MQPAENTQFLFFGCNILNTDESSKILVHCTAYIYTYIAPKPFYFRVVGLAVMTLRVMGVFLGNFLKKVAISFNVFYQTPFKDIFKQPF